MLDTAATPVSTTIYRKDYQPPSYLVDAIELTFELGEEQTKVTSKMQVSRNPEAEQTNKLILDGDGLIPEKISLDGSQLDTSDYHYDDISLTINQATESFELEIITLIQPQENTKLMGLYKSSGNFCTQCEAQGFRKITFFPDRPDVLTTYTVTIYADKNKYPVLLSNGNRVDSGEQDNGLHWVRWHDPFPKPSYLFALVAGDLEKISDTYTTASDREVLLEIYSEAHNIDQCDFAMESLKKSMRWDEEVYGLEYDLDIYMVVAVDDFNMGAMENKGLNIFNTKYVLAHSDTATDNDFLGVESVIAHEYFHNWSGNRVTCRDWFQLSLKEGFTVYRDQEFSADMHSRGVKRVEDVNILRTYQFREDSGPMAHPVRPESYQQINNFYTLTVYNKGAEVVRMLATIIGKQGFRKGSDLYFQRHDGQAVTIEDFVAAMEDANNIDLEQFRLWYSQAGTPQIKVTENYDRNSQQYVLILEQSCPDTPGQADKLAFHIPIKAGLLAEDGDNLGLISNDPAVVIDESGLNAVLNLKQQRQKFVFEQVAAKPVCSFLRGFSAPVKVEFIQDENALSQLMAHDSDSFNRWEAAQRLMRQTLLELIDNIQNNRPHGLPDHLVDAVGRILSSEITDQALAAHSLVPPSEIYLSQQVKVIDPDAIHQAREFMIKELAHNHKDKWLSLYESLSDSGDYIVDQVHVGRRSLRQVCLSYLISLDHSQIWHIASNQYKTANNMTERLAAFHALVKSSSPDTKTIIDDFYTKFEQHALVMDKWLAVQATVAKPETLKRVKQLEKKRIFDRKNPNKLRSLVGTFVAQNPVCFHAIDGSGYEYLTDWLIELDPVNPQVAARLAGSFNSWRSYDEIRQSLMKKALEKINNAKNLSKDVKEIVTKALDS